MSIRLVGAAGLLAVPLSALADPLPPLTDEQLLDAARKAAETEETIEIHDDAPAESASSVHLGHEQLRTRSWWTGAEGYLLIDDYDLVATSQGNPIAALAPLLAQASDVDVPAPMKTMSS